MGSKSELHLSRRESQIMDVVYRQGEASAADVLAAIPDPPGYSAVRTLLRILEGKGHLKHSRRGARYVYTPTQSRRAAAKLAMRRVVQTFCEGSAAQALEAVIEVCNLRSRPKELEALAALLAQARKAGRATSRSR